MKNFEPTWISQHRRVARKQVWRAVEAQHQIATMSLADNLDEQHLLEQMLETSKPPLPQTINADYLLTTPFRYTSAYPSRFRRPNESGVWYGAEDIATACAEVGYWRWRFLIDSEGLVGKEVRAELTIFQARVQGQSIDLTATPWNDLDHAWSHPTDYSGCHNLAEQARTGGIHWIRYRSVRWPKGICAAALSPTALDRPHPERIQTWRCRISAEQLHFSHENTWMSVDPEMFNQ